MEIRFQDNYVCLIYKGYELGEFEMWQQELALNVWEQRDFLIQNDS